MRPRTADYEMKPMLGDETEAQIPRASFAAWLLAASTGPRQSDRRVLHVLVLQHLQLPTLPLHPRQEGPSVLDALDGAQVGGTR